MGIGNKLVRNWVVLISMALHAKGFTDIKHLEKICRIRIVGHAILFDLRVC